MTDTVESLRKELNALRKEFEEFKDYAKPVIDAHQPPTEPLRFFTGPMPVYVPPQ